MEYVYCNLKYLKGTPSIGLFFKKNGGKTIEAFTNTDWVEFMTDKRSMLLCFCFGEFSDLEE